MLGEEATTPARMVRLRNTVRMSIKEDATLLVKERFRRDFVVVELLKGVFKIPATAVFCLQDFATVGFFDLTFFGLKDCVSFFESWEKMKEHALLQGLHLQPVFTQDFLPLTVHIYNPFVEDGDVMAFLARHCEAVRGGERLRDKHGIWNGKRRFLVRLKMMGGDIIHPPGSFSIGSNRGFLHYPGQPMYCRRCGGQGHIKSGCPGLRCRFCGMTDHSSAECKAPKKCSLCGSEEHLYRLCPQRRRTFASLFREEDALQVESGTLLRDSEEASKSPARSPQRQPQEAEEMLISLEEQQQSVSEGELEEEEKVEERITQDGTFKMVPPSQEWSEIDVTEIINEDPMRAEVGEQGKEEPNLKQVLRENRKAGGIEHTPNDKDEEASTSQYWSDFDISELLSGAMDGRGQQMQDTTRENTSGRSQVREHQRLSGSLSLSRRKASSLADGPGGKCSRTMTVMGLEAGDEDEGGKKGRGDNASWGDRMEEEGEGEGGILDSGEWTEVVERRAKGGRREKGGKGMDNNLLK